MTPEVAAALREPFAAEKVGKLPRIWCGACRDARTKVCSEHTKGKCDACQGLALRDLKKDENHNGLDRGPSRTSDEEEPRTGDVEARVVRDGPRSNPLWSQHSCAICAHPLDPAAGDVHPACESPEGVQK